MKRIILDQEQRAPSSGITSIPEFQGQGAQASRTILGTVRVLQSQGAQSSFYMRKDASGAEQDAASQPAKTQRACQPGASWSSAPVLHDAQSRPAFQPGTRATRILMAQQTWAACKEDGPSCPEQPGGEPRALPSIIRRPSPAPGAEDGAILPILVQRAMVNS